MCVGFLYTPLVKVPSACGVIMVSQNAMEPSDMVSSTVSWMDESTELMCFRSSSLCNWCWITKVSSTCLPDQRLVHCWCDGCVFRQAEIRQATLY